MTQVSDHLKAVNDRLNSLDQKYDRLINLNNYIGITYAYKTNYIEFYLMYTDFICVYYLK